MYDLKNILGIIATVLVFIGYAPYIRDVINGKTKPHLYSWFLWCFVTLIAFALQWSGGAGIGSLVTLAAGIMCGAVLVLGLIKKSTVKIVAIDTVFLVLAFVALGLWIFAKQPVLSALLTTLIDVLGFAPTVRKSWHNPFSETQSFYYLNSFRFALGIIALQQYSLVTALYPITWFFANGLFALLLLLRRRQLAAVSEVA
jgi:hypothetical protein